MKNLKKSLLLLSALLMIQIAVFAQTGTKVYTTESGTKYHKETCRYLAKSKYETTKVKAKNDGYTACKVCKPGDSTTKAIKTSSTSSQCTGKTQAGNRCKRMTKSSNGRCHSH